MIVALGLFAVWFVAPAAASASPTWSLKGLPITESAAAVKWSGKLKVTDNSVPIFSKLASECEDSAEGKAGLEAAGEVTKWTMSKCVNVTNCEAPSVTAVNLPWSSELAMVGGTLYDKLVSGGKGAPEFEVNCTGIKDRCSGTILASVSNGSKGVSAAFDSSEMLTCSLRETASGSLSGSQSIEATSGALLGAEESPNWLSNGARLESPKSVTWSGAITLSDNIPGWGSASVKCEDTASGYVGPLSAGEVTSVTMTKCEGASCPSGTLEASALSWHTHLYGSSTVGDAFGGTVHPRLKMTCAGSGNFTDECPLPPMTITNTETGVSAAFNREEKFSCTAGRNEGGKIESTQTIKGRTGIISVS